MTVWMHFGIVCKDKEFQCEEPAAYSSTSSVFVEAGDERRLIDINATGTRISALDFDKDVYIELTGYHDTRRLLYHQYVKGMFEPVPIEFGFDYTCSHNIEMADSDRDGDLDMVISHSLERCDDCSDIFHVRRYENQLSDNYLQVHIEVTDSRNISAIHARMEVETDVGIQDQELNEGFGHYGAQNDLTVHLSLGLSCESKVRVRCFDTILSETEYTFCPKGRVQIF